MTWESTGSQQAHGDTQRDGNCARFTRSCYHHDPVFERNSRHMRLRFLPEAHVANGFLLACDISGKFHGVAQRFHVVQAKLRTFARFVPLFEIRGDSDAVNHEGV